MVAVRMPNAEGVNRIEKFALALLAMLLGSGTMSPKSLACGPVMLVLLIFSTLLLKF